MKKILLFTLVGFICFSLVACKKKKNENTNPNETTNLVLSTLTPDGVFNPFFSTSGVDSDIVGQTQLSMLGTDDEGKIKVGEDEPTVVLDYSELTTDTRPNKNDKEDYENYYTTYKFLVKNGIKFSDGVDLTIKDIMFNLYMYLDPIYSGSSTMYSTDIQGLKAFRAQTDNEGEQNNFERRFEEEANNRLDNIRAWCDDALNDTYLTQVLKDIETVKELFKDELQSDWNNAQNSIVDYEETYQFTAGWQIMLFNYNVITIKPNIEQDQYETPEALNWNGWDKRPSTETSETYILDYLFNRFFDDDLLGTASEKVYKDNLYEVVTYYNTALTAKARFIQEAKSDYFAKFDTLAIPNISGITTYKTSTFNEESLGEEHDVLQIVINGVDPKAIWNFGFGVAPMHYYSTSEEVALYDGESHFGVKFGNTEFMESVQEKLIPLGAGPYKATDSRGRTENLERSEFFDSAQVYFGRNDYFLLGAPKIKNLRYKVINSNKLFEAVKMGEVHYADPSAKPEYINEINLSYQNQLGYATPQNLGYGYIGVNAKYVNSLKVRQAIMYAMDTSLILEYYPNEMASIIHRPMSSISWAYPKGATAYYPFVGNTDQGVETIKKLVESDGYYLNSNGVYERRSPVTGKTETLEFTFTLAGQETDHPAYNTFSVAEQILEKAGFRINVKPDPDALTKLSTGSLAIWAAAWSSTIDPDMYQVYHKESKATSVNNWGYPWLFENGSEEELEIIDRLSELIDQGRENIDQNIRSTIYAQALDKVMELAVELPTYQRKNLFVYNIGLIDSTTLQQNISPYNGPLSRIWEVSFIGGK